MSRRFGRGGPSGRAEEAWTRIVEEAHLATGDRLPSERQLAVSLDVSRGTVREILKAWEAQGRVVIRPGAGCFLRDRHLPHSEHVLEVFGEKLRVMDIFEVRRGLEVTGVRLAAIRASEEDLTRLGQLVDRMQALVQETRTDSFLQFIQVDQLFHRAIQEATHNPLYPVLFQALSPVLEKVSWNASRRTGARQHALDYHRKIVRAIQQKNPDLGAAVMELHLSDAEELLTAVLAGEE